jgi:hypothetical protein
MFDGALELKLKQLSRELINLDVPGGAEIVRAALLEYLASPASQVWLEQASRTSSLGKQRHYP